MPLVSDGAAGLTQIDPGSSAWLAQLNANMIQINDEQPWASIFTAGELIPAGKWVYLNSDGKIYLADWSVLAKRYAIGFCSQQILLNATGKVYHMGKINFISGEALGARLYLNTAGAMANAPADGTDLAKRLVVGMQVTSADFLVNVLHTMNAF